MLLKLLLHIWGGVNRSIQDFCDLETVDNDTLVANDGSLATIVRIDGFQTLMSVADLEDVCASLDIGLSPFFNKIGHQLQIVFHRDDEENEELEELRILKKLTAKKMQLSLDNLIDEQIDKYYQYVYNESCYFVFWSRPMLLNKIEATEKNRKEFETRKKEKIPPLIDAQNISMETGLLMQQHLSFVHTVNNKLNQLKLITQVLSAQEMLYEVKKQILPTRTTRNWRASFPGQPIPFRWKTIQDHDLSELMYPRLANQIMTANAIEGDRKTLDDTLVKFGEHIYAPIFMDIPPMNPQYFSELFGNLNRIQITNRYNKPSILPYTLCLVIEGGGLTGVALNTILSSMLGYASGINRNINDAKRALLELKENNHTLIKFKLSACTWATVGTREEQDIILRKANLIKAIESWGNAKMIDKTGSPMEALQCTSLGLTYKHVGNGGAAPLIDILRMLPITRPANIFKDGTLLYRSKDGKLFKYKRFTSAQTTWITLISGRPGFGKSVLMNDGSIEICLGSMDKNELPYICNIDIGVTSQGMIDLIRESLPLEQKHLAMYTRLQNSPHFCMNPFDTSLGCRIPLKKDRTYLINFLSLLATPAERRGKSYEGMSDFVTRIIDMVYQNKAGISDRSNPNRYTFGHNKILDDAVQKHNLYQPSIAYWDLVDAFFEKQDYYAAEIAQRYAVPLLDDCISSAASVEIIDEYKKIFTESGTPIYEAFQIGMRGGISQFPLFAGVTQFDIGSARVMSLDLNDVTSGGKTDNEIKQNALMYMMARQAFTKKIGFSGEDLMDIPKLYQDYYKKMIDKLQDAYKSLCYDEYHRTGNVEAIQSQTITDGREGRKWQMEVVVASQFLEDMGSLAQIATNIFICDAGTKSSREYLSKTLGLNSVHENALVNNCTGPNQHGMSFLAIQDHKDYSKIFQIYTLSIGPKRLWGLSTTAEDRRLRSLIMTKGHMSRDQALDILAKKFPSGSCKKAVELQAQNLAEGSENKDADELASSIVENIAKDILASLSL